MYSDAPASHCGYLHPRWGVQISALMAGCLMRAVLLKRCEVSAYLHRRGGAARLCSSGSVEPREGRAFMPADHVHFNGSVNLADAESVMREIAARVPSGLWRIPDGETGDRGNWIFFQLQKFLQLPWLVTARSMGEEDGEYEQLPLLRLAEGVDPAQVTWPDI